MSTSMYGEVRQDVKTCLYNDVFVTSHISSPRKFDIQFNNNVRRGVHDDTTISCNNLGRSSWTSWVRFHIHITQNLAPMK